MSRGITKVSCTVTGIRHEQERPSGHTRTPMYSHKGGVGGGEGCCDVRRSEEEAQVYRRGRKATG